jgi:hypothetical protein
VVRDKEGKVNDMYGWSIVISAGAMTVGVVDASSDGVQTRAMTARTTSSWFLVVNVNHVTDYGEHWRPARVAVTVAV